MTPEDIILIPSVKEWARSHSSFFFSDGIVTATGLVKQLREGAAALGARTIETSGVEGWSIVASSEDWFANARLPLPENFVFENLTPFPELGQNCVRPEAVMAMFAEDIVVASSSSSPIVHGAVSPHDAIYKVLQGKRTWSRLVAFRGVGAEA